jgi:hypothetical protein
MTSKSKYFVHFGCWNKLGCSMKKTSVLSENSSDTTRVMIKLRDYIQKKKNPSFITVAGDNFYPNKNKDPNSKVEKVEKVKKDKDKKDKDKDTEQDPYESDIKEVRPDNMDKGFTDKDREDLKSGFGCLPDKIKKFILIGNHELDTIQGQCRSLALEMNIVNFKNSSFFMDRPDNDYILHEHFNKHTIIIMLDTTMLTATKKFVKYAKCYMELYGINSHTKESNSAIKRYLISIQTARVINLIRNVVNKSKNIQNIVFVGHHPLVELKTEKPSEKNPAGETNLDYVSDFLDFFYNLYLMIAGPKKIYYLCADLHQYQKGVINYKQMKVDQYIVGTGGTKLDPEVNVKDLKKPINSYLNYEVRENRKNHGFLVCKETNSQKDLSFTFIEA